MKCFSTFNTNKYHHYSDNYIVQMLATLTIVRYPAAFSWAGMLSMAVFRLPLLFRRNIHFYKLLGCGKNGTFDKTPDLQQWGLLIVHDETTSHEIADDIKRPETSLQNLHSRMYGPFISKWWKMYACNVWTIVLQPIEGHGLWDNKKAFGDLPKTSDHDGLLAVLTRATIRLNKLNRFWQHVGGAAKDMATAPGFITSLGIGEMPWIKQATFSIWQSKAAMKEFAYKMKDHAEVVRKTRSENWYSEEMFVRFAILASFGSLNGIDPLKGKL